MTDWIFLSPHLDDAVLSAGGLIAEQIKSGKQIEIWTVCAGNPPAGELPHFAEGLHTRWQTGPDAIISRRREDKEACHILGVKSRHLDIPDCIYRRLPNGEALINEEKDLFRPLNPGEKPLVTRLAQTLIAALPANVPLVCPLTIGGHVDHRLVRAAAEVLRRPVWFYAEFPYIASDMTQLSSFVENSWRAFLQWITPEGLGAWQEAIKAYPSQISTFWTSATEMSNAVEKYWRSGGGEHFGNLALEFKFPWISANFAFQNPHKNSSINLCYTNIMGVDSSYWPNWARSLHRWGVDQHAAAMLEAAGPLGLLAAQFVYLGQPLFSGPQSHAKWSALAQLLESETDRLSFASFLREEGSP